MLKILRGAAAYALLTFAAGFVLGTLRALFLAPWLGESSAVAIELPFMLTWSWLACGWSLRLLPEPSTGGRIAMGMAALVILLLLEAALSLTLGGLTLSQHFALYTTAPVLIGLAGQIVFAAFPVFRGRRP